MHVLPARTAPAGEGLRRTHRPTPGPYRRYRQCLRWEFGFSCAFCLLHEADFDEHGLGSLGTMWIEHHVPQVVAPHLANRYANCFYCCRFCNQRRRVRPVRAAGRRLLHPCRVAWADHFALDGDALRPRTLDAAYTAFVYAMNDRRRTTARRERSEALEEARKVMRRPVAGLFARARHASRSDRAAWQNAINDLLAAKKRALKQLQRYRAVPFTAEPCHCRMHPALPPYLSRQVTIGPGSDH